MFKLFNHSLISITLVVFLLNPSIVKSDENRIVPENEIACNAAYTEAEFLSILNNIEAHISGTSILSGAQIASEQTALQSTISILSNNARVIEKSFDVVALFESVKGPLFVQGSTTSGSFTRTGTNLRLERFMLYLQQSILDYSYTRQNLTAFPQLFTNVKFETSSYFPGAANPPANSNVSYTIKINGKHVKSWGTPANYEKEDARRPTGCYLAPGSIATVRVPASLVGIGASILVGAHTWDHTKKPNIKRMDRVTKKYEITSQTVTIANPLGGGIYINVPFEKDLGLLNITLGNVIRSPYYANTVANKTSLSEWQNEERVLEAPWTDFESEKVMMQVPTSWIYTMNNPSRMMADWDLSMDGISEMLGRPLIRSKTVVYSQVDVQSRGGANFPGYPTANTPYDPNRDYGGNHNNYLVRGPRNDRTNAATVFFHELGHGEKIYKSVGEIEAFVNFLWVAVHNKKFGVEIDLAFKESSTTNVKHTINEAAISWMITENFRRGNRMSNTTGQFRQEFSYQPRGYAKYADIVRLFGWEALDQFYYNLNESYENGTYDYNGNVNTVPTDRRVLRMSIASGYDMRPLLHFWGKHPDNFNGLATSIEDSGVKESVAIYDQLMTYKTIIPMNNTAFRSFGLKTYNQSQILNYPDSKIFYNNVSQSYYEGFYKKWWNDYNQADGQATVDEVQNIIDLYFPDGRPDEDTFCLNQATDFREAECYDDMFGIKTEQSSEGTENIGWIQNGDWTSYNAMDLSGMSSIEARVACNIVGGTIEIRLDSPTGRLLGVLPVSNTGGNQIWETVRATITSISGIQNVYLVFKGGNGYLFNINYFGFSEATLSITENETNSITTFPNPVKNTLHIINSEALNVELYNCLGQLQYKSKVNSNEYKVDVSTFSSGIYFLKTFTAKTVNIQKIIKK